jgi:hypothetical protein
VFLAISQSLLSNGLVTEIQKRVSNLDPATIVAAGATGIRNIVSPQELPLVLDAYNMAVRNVFIMGVVLGGSSFLAACAFEFKSIKGKNLAAGMA